MPHQVHRMRLELALPDWPVLTTDELHHVLQDSRPWVASLRCTGIARARFRRRLAWVRQAARSSSNATITVCAALRRCVSNTASWHICAGQVRQWWRCCTTPEAAPCYRTAIECTKCNASVPGVTSIATHCRGHRSSTLHMHKRPAPRWHNCTMPPLAALR